MFLRTPDPLSTFQGGYGSKTTTENVVGLEIRLPIESCPSGE